MKLLRHYAFTLLLLLGIIVGGLSGVVFGESALIVKPVGSLFLNLMFVIIVPLVFLSVSSSIAGMSQMTRLGKIMGTVFAVFVSTALFAAIIAYIGTQFYNPFQGVDTRSLVAHLPPAPDNAGKGLGEIIVATFTVPDFLQLFTKSSLLPLIVFAILFGLATSMSGEKGKPVADFLHSGTTVILRMVKIIMYAAPVGLGCYFAATVGELGPQIISGYLNSFLLYLLLTVIYFFGANTLYAFIAGGTLGVRVFWGNVLTPAVTAIATSSSAACIPVNLVATKKMGVPDDIAETVIPLGANTHKDGSVIGGVIKIVFLFTLFHKDMSDPSSILAIISVAFLVGAVMGAIPSGGMTGELMICAVFGFSPELVGAVMIISTIIDVPATLLNSTGNTVCAMMVTRFVEGKDWLKQRVLGQNAAQA
ncbi:dicarboxylate/amino acid:cation symporter [Enterobacillus tribolii]|uniref:Na+/H+-dicarboxylate symporter n=1 Tax=Enterobacillus tribolii TaxID=1487935 RepID=A0A370QGR2_9GAMM|nr:dicarboxylate/amino acid:cation symporter [Enterobacillus tribolii]MBW7981864.1 dicarboxylate/amino acid:cation symporter [Enterobacillus tribolii]RDK87546.1 Na+/H+-dicarboxylate symporter [Enterobacillus tribolii]